MKLKNRPKHLTGKTATQTSFDVHFLKDLEAFLQTLFLLYFFKILQKKKNLGSNRKQTTWFPYSFFFWENDRIIFVLSVINTKIYQQIEIGQKEGEAWFSVTLYFYFGSL